jgi:cell wall-associated NlpC family hydrolase
MDGLSAVQSRISEIQTRFLITPTVSPSAAWSSAATDAGLPGPTATTATTASSTSAAPASSAGGSGSAVVQAAQRYLGVPYAWGGTDPSTGLDCSGLVQRVYSDLGVDLPRTSSQQATSGRAVASLDEAQPGDLVFFDYSPSRPGVDHVGIYVGDGKMIAAPQEGESVKVQDVGRPTVIRRVLADAPATGATASSGSASSGTGSLAGVPYADLFSQAGSRYGVDPAVLAGMARTESGFDSSAVSAAGAQGLMQFMPATAAGLGVDPSDPASSIDGAARYLSSLTEQFGSTELALAAYNAGPGTVARYGGIPPYGETQSYVQHVTSAAEAYR